MLHKKVLGNTYVFLSIFFIFYLHNFFISLLSMAFLVTGNPTCPRLRVSGNPLVVRASCHFENTTSTRGPLRGLSFVLCNLSLCSSLCLVACILCSYWSSSLYFVFVLVFVLVLVLVPVLVLVQVLVLV